MIAYKQFRQDKSGNLHPLFVFANETIPLNEWIKAKEGPKLDSGKVKSKLGPLAYRPGWHLSEAPYAPHIGIKENGRVKYMRPDTVWAVCIVNDTNNYTEVVRRNGLKPNGLVDLRKACMSTLPEDGFYWYNTSPNAFGSWLITDRIMVLRVLTDDEVEDICWGQFNVHAQPRKEE